MGVPKLVQNHVHLQIPPFLSNNTTEVQPLGPCLSHPDVVSVTSARSIRRSEHGCGTVSDPVQPMGR